MFFRLQLAIDRLIASEEVRQRVRGRVRYARARHGSDAATTIRAKLADPRRRKSLRELRLALDGIDRIGLVA